MAADPESILRSTGVMDSGFARFQRAPRNDKLELPPPLAVLTPPTKQGTTMVIGIAHLQPIVALVAGILILIIPRLLNIIVAVYLIIVGLMGLNAIHHFVQ